MAGPLIPHTGSLSTPHNLAASPVLTSGNRILVWIIAVVALAALALAAVSGTSSARVGRRHRQHEEDRRGRAGRRQRLPRTAVPYPGDLRVRRRSSCSCCCPPTTTSQRIGRSIFFLVGAVFSAITGYVGMWLAVRSNVRVAAAARAATPAPGEPPADLTTVSHRAMKIAFRTGGVVGMFTVGLGLLGASVSC